MEESKTIHSLAPRPGNLEPVLSNTIVPNSFKIVAPGSSKIVPNLYLPNTQPFNTVHVLMMPQS